MANNPPAGQEYSTLKICFWNANGLKSKRLEVMDFLAIHKLNVLLVQETHLREHQKLKIPGMRSYRTDRADGFGGTAVFINDSIQHHQLYLRRTNNMEATGVQILTGRGPLNLFSVYIPPNKSLTRNSTCCSRPRYRLSQPGTITQNTLRGTPHATQHVGRSSSTTWPPGPSPYKPQTPQPSITGTADHRAGWT